MLRRGDGHRKEISETKAHYTLDLWSRVHNSLGRLSLDRRNLEFADLLAIQAATPLLQTLSLASQVLSSVFPILPLAMPPRALRATELLAPALDFKELAAVGVSTNAYAGI